MLLLCCGFLRSMDGRWPTLIHSTISCFCLFFIYSSLILDRHDCTTTCCLFFTGIGSCGGPVFRVDRRQFAVRAQSLIMKEVINPVRNVTLREESPWGCFIVQQQCCAVVRVSCSVIDLESALVASCGRRLLLFYVHTQQQYVRTYGRTDRAAQPRNKNTKEQQQYSRQHIMKIYWTIKKHNPSNRNRKVVVKKSYEEFLFEQTGTQANP